MKIDQKKVLIKGVKTSYSVVGNGQPLLILHGWPSSSNSWLEVQEILAQQGFQVICPDFPGFGASEVPANSWDLDDYLAWTVAFTDFLKLKEFTVLGHSFGGRVAIKLSVKYPTKVKSLILCGAAGIKPELTFKQKMIIKVAQAGNVLFSYKLLAEFKNAARRFFYLFLPHKDYIKANTAMKETMRKIIAEDLISLLSKIKARTLLVWGEKDKMVPLKYGHIFKEKISDSELKIILNAGHSPHKQAAATVAEIILKFL